MSECSHPKKQTRGSSGAAATSRQVSIGIAIVLVLAALVAGQASAEPVGTSGDVGDLGVTDAYDGSKPVTHGDAKTEFTVRVPTGASCPGDSANDQWRVQSFLIPLSEDPADIKYGAIGPEPVGNGRYALFGADTTPFVHQLTVRNATAGQPGVIAPLPTFSFEVVAGEHIPSGEYRVGVACTYFGKTDRYWDTQVVLTESADTKVSKFRWRLASEPASVEHAGDGSNSSAVIIFAIVAGAAAVLGLAYLSRRRSARRAPNLSKEPA